jgi:flagellar M-ring protein FliF
VPEFLNKLFEQLGGLFGQMSGAQKLIIGLVVVGLIGSFAFLANFGGAVNTVTLFTDLAPDEAGQIRDRLTEMGITYELGRGGTEIRVPGSRVYDLRLTFAMEGLPTTGVVGYEIFDKTNIGMTDFVQKQNFRRALEGEMVRTLERLSAVKRARVHIVIPKKTVFTEKETPATAAISLQLSPGAELVEAQIRGITYLVARSVEGLSTENVTIVDFYGNILYQGTKDEEVIALTANQIALKTKVESYLTRMTESLLTNVVGPNDARVQVSVELDFTQSEIKSEDFNPDQPDKSIVRSEEREEEAGGGEGAGTKERSTTNYEVDRQIQTIIDKVGRIQNLSAAVFIDDQYRSLTPDGRDTVVVRTEAERLKIEDIVQRAGGFQANRGDQVSVQFFHFDDYTERLAQRQEESERTTEFVNKIVTWGLSALGVLILFLFFRPILVPFLKEGVRVIVPSMAPPKELALPEVEEEEIEVMRRREAEEELPGIEYEVTEAATMLKQLVNYAQQKPAEVTKLIKSWLVET